MLLKQLQLSGRRWTQLWEYECNEFTERSLTVYAYDITESRAYERQLRLYHLTSFIFYSMEMRDTVRLHLCLVLLCLLLLRRCFMRRPLTPVRWLGLLWYAAAHTRHLSPPIHNRLFVTVALQVSTSYREHSSGRDTEDVPEGR